VLIVDDHAPFRRLARRLLEAGPFSVVGEASDGASALAASAAFTPELVVLDVLLPDMDGFMVARRLAAQRCPPRIVLVSSRDATGLGRRLDDAPIEAFIAKDELSAAALWAIADSEG
jgi:two-component system nitrate/nitrite response regulator NarL